MKVSVVFPMFWGREKAKVYEEDDFYYDHPTPIDSDGTIPPLFKSMDILADKDFDVVVVSGANARSYRKKVEEAAEKLIAREKRNYDAHTFSYSQLERLHGFFREIGKDHLNETLSLTGYSPLRNLCLVVANVLDSDIAISIDDDIVFVLPEYISMIKERIKTEFNGKEILALCGPYLTEKDAIYLPVKKSPISAFWNNIEVMNRAFRKYIVEGPRLKEVHFAIMGNIAVHRDFYMRIPLDPYLPRGEDSDWVMNANIFGYRFIMDNTLLVKHLPASRPYPSWRPLREDVYRFQHIRKKIACSYDSETTKKLDAAAYRPFPGEFFTDTLPDKVSNACFAQALEYLVAGDTGNAAEALKTIYLARYEATPDFDPFKAYLEFRVKWEEMMALVAENRERLRGMLFGE